MDIEEILDYAATLIQKVFRGFIVRQYVKKLKKHIYYSSAKNTMNEYGFCIQPKQQSNQQSIRSSTKSKHTMRVSHQKQHSKHVLNKCATKIQRVFRGYLSRKYFCDYHKLKAIVLFLEGHIHYFLRKRIQQRKTNIKALQAQCYNFQSYCKQIAQNRAKLSRFMNQKQFDEVNGVLFTSFLSLMISNFDKLACEQKAYYVEQLLQVCSSAPPNQKKNSKTPLKQRQIIQNVSVLSNDIIPSSTTSLKNKVSNLTNEQFKSLLQQQKKRK